MAEHELTGFVGMGGLLTVTDADAEAVELVQVRVYACGLVIAAVASDPMDDLPPDHAPLAEHEVASVEFHDNIEAVL